MARTNYRRLLADIAPGMEANRYYDGFRLTALLWRSIWFNSSTDWGRYRVRIWSMFSDRVQAAARTTGTLDGFLSRISRLLDLEGIGVNEDDRAEVVRMLAMPEEEWRELMRQLREDTPVLVALVRRWRDETKDEGDDLTEDTAEEVL